MSIVYSPLKQPRQLRCPVRGLNYMVRMWGSDSAPPLILLHGFRDASATFQFLVDALTNEWHVIAPDWRGHGQTLSSDHDPWFHEFLVDLDALLETLVPDRAVDIVGHSMGGNVANVYAALRPERVRHLVALDAFGTMDTAQAQLPDVLAEWLHSDRPKVTRNPAGSIEELAERLRASNRRLSQDKALYLAQNLSHQLPDGRFTWQYRVVGRRSIPTLRSLEEWAACWKRNIAPRLWVAATDARPNTVPSDPHAFAFVLANIEQDRFVRLPDTGHNLHHDAPSPLATLIETFMATPI